VKVRELIHMLESAGCRTRKEGGTITKYTAIYEKGPTSWGAYVPDLPGVIVVVNRVMRWSA
jgi:hypothetical protein